MTQPRLLLDADRYESDYGTNNTQISSLVRGQNVVTVDKNTPYNVLNIDGRTLANLLGRDGNCEDISKWTVVAGASALDTTNKTTGSNGIKLTGTTASGYGSYRYLNSTRTFDRTKNYILVVDLLNGTSSGIYLRFNQVTSGSQVVKVPTITSTASFSTAFIAYQANLSTQDMVLEAIVTGNDGATAYMDSIRIYELSTADYNLISGMTATQIANKYPYVDDVKHVQNPYLIKSGLNLLPPFQEWVLGSNSGAIITNSYVITANPNTLNVSANITSAISVLPNTTYTLTVNISANGQWACNENDINGNYISSHGWYGNTITTSTFTTSSTTYQLSVYTGNTTSTYIVTNPMLNIGSTALPFVPQNNDYLFTTTTLASSVDGSVKDYVYYKDGLYYKSKRFVTDMVLDGSLAWTFGGDHATYKDVYITVQNSTLDVGALVKFDGKIIPRINYTGGSSAGDTFAINTTTFDVNISDVDSGWGEAWTGASSATGATAAQIIQAYFNGWKYTGNFTTDSWTSLFDGSASPTQTIAYVTVNKAANFKPYKLTYQLAQEQEELIPFEGDINLHSGGNQIEYGEGVIVREKANPAISSGFGILNHNGVPSTQLKNKVFKILNVYKNGQKDSVWSHYPDSSSYGIDRVSTAQANFDPTAEYTVSYIVLQDGSFRSSVNSASAVYNTNLRNIVNQISQELTDVTTAEKALELRFQNFGIKGLGERIEYGTGVVGTESLNASLYYATASITFSRSFSKPPMIYLISSTTFAAWASVASPITTTGATIYLTSTQSGIVASKGVNWMAIGT